MPGEVSVNNLLRSLLVELKRVKGKTLDDLEDVMQNQDAVLIKLGQPHGEAIIDMYSNFSDEIGYARDPDKPDASYVNSFVDDVEAYINSQLKEKSSMGVSQQGSTRPYRNKFDTCVKSVRKTVKARRGSTKESAAIAICTKSVLQTRGRTMKRYRKGKLTTQKLKNKAGK